jgi:hypothetical protein
MALDWQSMGTWRMLWVRTLEIISHAAHTLMNRLQANGKNDGLSWRLLLVFRHEAEDAIAHTRGYLAEGVKTPLGTYEPQTPQPLPPAPTKQPLTSGNARDVALAVAAGDTVLDMDLVYDHGLTDTRATELLKRFEALGIVGPRGAGGVREVLVSPARAAELLDAEDHERTTSWSSEHETLSPRWFDDVKAALPGRSNSEVSASDVVKMLIDTSARMRLGVEAAETAQQRANQAVTLYLEGRGDEVPHALAGNGREYTRDQDGRWSLHTRQPVGSDAQREVREQKPGADTALPRRIRNLSPNGQPAKARAAAAPGDTSQREPISLTPHAQLSAQAERLRSRAEFALAAATTPAEERKAQVLLGIAQRSRATADSMAGGLPTGKHASGVDQALTAEALLAAIRTHAHAQGAQIPPDVLASAAEAAASAIATTPRRRPGEAASRPARQGRHEPAQEQRHPQRSHTPTGPRRR